MKVIVGNRTATLGPTKLLGRGGEACVYRWRDKAVKIYHDMPSAALAAKIAKLRAFPHDLPPEVLVPQDIVTDLDGHPVGFSMDLVHGAEDLKRLSQRRYREGVIHNREVVSLLTELHGILTGLHARDVVVGDLNDANVVFTRPETGCRPRLIDADSMQLAGFPCTVAHEQFLDPHLIGTDFATTAAFTLESDWYSFSTLVCLCLLYLHPYGGVHARYPTLLRRAQAQHSVLRPDVARPKAAADPRSLPDDLLAWLEAVFDQGIRDVFPRRLLDIEWTQCGCGTEHARLACPACAKTGTISLRPPVINHGQCRAVRIFAGPGRVLAVARQGDLKFLYEEDGVLRREDASAVARLRVEPGMRFGIAGGSTWIGQRQQLLEIRRGKIISRHTVTQLGNEPVFATGHNRCLYLQEQWLTDAASGGRLAALLEGQSWFRMGERLGYGFYRASELTMHFIFRPGEPGVKNIDLPPVSGRLIDIDVVFDDDHALVGLASEKSGAVTVALYLLGAGGELLASLIGAPESSPLLAHSGGFALHGGRIIAAREQGLMSVRIEHGLLAPDVTFADTEPFVAEGAQILPGPGGSIYVVHTREIIQLSLT